MSLHTDSIIIKKKASFRSRKSKFQTKSSKYQVKANNSGADRLFKLREDRQVLREADYDIVLKHYHDDQTHDGNKKMRKVLKAKYADVDVKTVDDYVANCMHCRTKKPSHSKAVHNKPIRIYNTFQRLGIDFAEYTDPRNGKDKYNLLVMIDFFSRFAWVEILPQKVLVNGDFKSSATGEMVAATLLRLFMSLCQVPLELQSDNGSQFTSACVKYLMEKMKVKLVHAAPNTPTTGGRFEVMVKTIKNCIDAKLNNNNDVDVEFAAAQACCRYNERPHESLCYGEKDLAPVDVWQPQLRQRLFQNRDILPDDLVDVEVTETDPPEFNEYDDSNCL